jgi:hypothetical protein
MYWALALAAHVAMCQVPGAVVTTPVRDTVYRADGTPAAGTVLLSWGAFTTPGGESIAAGSTSVTLGTGGALSVALAPNAGATPMGSFYKAVFHLDDGTTSTQYWVVPVPLPGGAPVTLASIQNNVLPTSVAMQTVSKQYVDNAISQAIIGYPHDSSPYVLKTGDTMTGPLALPADPVSAQQAADKNYVDNSVGAVSAGLSQKVSEIPTTTQVVAQPSGTQLQVNLLNGDLYATQYLSGTGSNGVGNALNSPDCASGCKVVIEPTYPGADGPAQGPNETAVLDERNGAEVSIVENPLPPASVYASSQGITQYETLSSPQLEALRPGSGGLGAYALSLTTNAQAGGNNQIPVSGAAPYAKSTYGALAMSGNYSTQGQHVQTGNVVNCYGVGDCLAGGQFITSEGGYRDPADEGTHPFDLQVSEDYQVFAGTCTSGCTSGSTSIMATATAAGGTQGDGRFLIDTNPAKTLSTGIIGWGTTTIFPVAQFAYTTFPVSVFLTAAQAVQAQPANMSPGTLTLPIATSGVTAGFATNTAALPATTGVACVADPDSAFPNYEMANYTVIDGTHIQLTLNKTHKTGTTIAVGGLCGYGLEQTVDTVGAVRQIFPVVGSYDATDLYYAGALTPIVGGQDASASSTSAYLNVSEPVASISRTNNVVSVTLAHGFPEDVNGLTMTVSGVADSSYNGSFPITTTSVSTLTYPDPGPDSTSTGGNILLYTGGYVLYPMAEVLSVYDPATKSVDGSFTLAANTVPWAPGDTLEEPHYFQQITNADIELITQYVPRPMQYSEAGKIYGGNVGPGMRGWQIGNSVPESQYLGAGGTHRLPDDAYLVTGAWANDFAVEAGANAVIVAGCNLNGCDRWDSAYDLFELQSAANTDFLRYDPASSSATWNLRGVGYTFSTTGFTAGTINVGTLNATTINGGVSGSAINSGTIAAAYLPLFGPSGTTHAPGIVPDPGATAGSTRYLREDGTWDVPAGGSGTAFPSDGDLVQSNSAGQAVSSGIAAANVPLLNASNTFTASNNTFQNITLNAGSITSTVANSGQQILGFHNPSANPLVVTFGNDYSDSSHPGQMLMTVNNDGSTVLQPIQQGTAFRSLTLGGSGTPSYTGHNTLDDGNGNAAVSGSFTSQAYVGPASAPSGSCPVNGQWVFSQDGHATFCAAGSWVTKI